MVPAPPVVRAAVQLPHATHASPDAAPPREARGVAQRVTNRGTVPLAGAWVVLHRVGNDHAAPVDSLRTGASGRFEFRYRATGDTSALYFIATRYDGIAYFTPPLRKPVVAGGDADLLVYDTTSAPVRITVRGRHVIVTAPDTGKARSVIEVFELSNDSSVTRVAGARGLATFATTLPDGALAPEAADGDVPAAAVKFEKGRVLVFAPIAPGVKQFSFHYRLPLAKAPITIPSLAATGVLEVLVEDAQGTASGAKLKATTAVTLDGRRFKRFLAQDAPANAVISVVAPTRVGAAFSARMALVVLAIGTVMLAGLAASLMRKGPLVARASETGEVDPDAIARQVAALDDAFEANASPTDDERADHYQRRARLKARLTAALARRDGL
jgi:hypothetical protein